MLRKALPWFPAALTVALAVPACAQDAAQEDWRLYQFHASEEYRYEIEQVEDGETSTGHYALSVEPAGKDRLKINVEGQVGDTECSGSVTVESAQAVPQQLMMGCMMLAPALMPLYAGAWAGFMGRPWVTGDSWRMSQGGQSVSFSIEGECRHAGQTGQLAVMKENDAVRLQSCVSRNAALPLAFVWSEEDGDSIAMTLVEYHR